MACRVSVKKIFHALKNLTWSLFSRLCFFFLPVTTHTAYYDKVHRTMFCIQLVPCDSKHRTSDASAPKHVSKKHVSRIKHVCNFIGHIFIVVTFKTTLTSGSVIYTLLRNRHKLAWSLNYT